MAQVGRHLTVSATRRKTQMRGARPAGWAVEAAVKPRSPVFLGYSWRQTGRSRQTAVTSDQAREDRPAQDGAVAGLSAQHSDRNSMDTGLLARSRVLKSSGQGRLCAAPPWLSVAPCTGVKGKKHQTGLSLSKLNPHRTL